MEKLTDYEKIRNTRVAEINAKMQELGMPKLVTDLRESIRSNKRKDKEKPRNDKDKDVEYIPNEDDLEKGASETEVPRKVKRLGSGKRVQYIPPSIVRDRSTFRNNQLGSLTDETPSTVSRKELASQNDAVQRASDKKQKNGKKMTMADLILQRKPSTNSPEFRSISSHEKEPGSKGSSSMDKDADDIFHDFQEETDDDEDMALQLLDAQLSQTIQELGLDENSEDEIQLDATDSRTHELQSTRQQRTRGPSMLHEIHVRPLDQRMPVLLNDFGQPIGPEVNGKNMAAELSRLLGTLARDYSYAPLVFPSWHKVPNKEKLWEYVLKKFDVPVEGKDWVLKTLGALWRMHKCRFKSSHYYRYNDDRTRWKNRPKTVPEQDFMKLLANWKKKSEQALCSRNRQHRLRQKNSHTAGAKSFAIIREEMKNEHVDKESPSLAALFERTRKRSEDKNYKESYDDTAKKIDDMKHYVPPTEDSGPTDPFLGVMGKEYHGTCRLYGRGVSNKKLKNADALTTSYVVPGDILHSIKTSLLEDLRKDMDREFTREEEKRKEAEEELEKKKADLEKMQQEIENQRDAMTEQIMMKIVGKLPIDIARQYLT